MMLLSQKKGGKRKQKGGEAIGPEDRKPNPDPLSLSLTHALSHSRDPLSPLVPLSSSSRRTASHHRHGHRRRARKGPRRSPARDHHPLSSPRTEPVSGTSGGLEAPPTCRNSANHPESTSPISRLVEFNPNQPRFGRIQRG